MAKQTVTITKGFTIGGVQFSENKAILGEVPLAVTVDLPVAKAGTLSTRTDNDTGTLTMASGHGITTGARLDLYWTGGCRRGVVVGTVATNSVPIDGGSGDNLPIATTVISAMVPVKRRLAFDGDELQLLAVNGPAGVVSQFTFVDDADAELHYIKNIGGVVNAWYDDYDPTNPVAGDDVFSVFISHGDITATRNLKVGALTS